MMRALRCGVLPVVCALVGCGTTSNIQPSQKPESVEATSPQKGQPSIDLSGYDRVVVLDFTDATDKSVLKAEQVRQYSDTMATAVRTFPDLVAKKIRDTAAFGEVVRSASPGRALVVSGRITRLVEGSATARLFLPGAGSSHFEATTDLTDGESGASLGHLTTDKNSWVLGGGIAATQSVQSFMEGAAEKIAAQLQEQKKGLAAAKKS